MCVMGCQHGGGVGGLGENKCSASSICGHGDRSTKLLDRPYKIRTLIIMTALPALILAALVLRFTTAAVIPRDTCQGDGPDNGACQASTFSNIALPVGGHIETVSRVSNGCYGEGVSNLESPLFAHGLPQLCAVTVHAGTYRFGLFFPDNWTGQFLTVGNGAFGGGIEWLEMGVGVNYSMAVMSTDTGHSSLGSNMSWALNNKTAQEAWGYKAMDGSVQYAKQFTAAYYTKLKSQTAAITYSYYSGCSTGGRQGLKHAQYNPSLFDGIIAGSPAYYTSRYMPYITEFGRRNNNPNPDDNILLSHWPILTDLARLVCDAQDGVTDGIISLDNCTIRAQDFDDHHKRCPPGEASNNNTCLTDGQIQTALSLYQSYTTKDGVFVYPGPMPGSESGWVMTLPTVPEGFGQDWERYWVYNVSDAWDPKKLDVDQVFRDSDRGNPGQATANQTDLSNFKGKMILYHGLADGLIPVEGSTMYYKAVQEQMKSKGPIEDWFRYFQVPGMAHCFESPSNAPWMFNGSGQANQMNHDTNYSQNYVGVPGHLHDKQYDVLAALVDWVEGTKKPVESIIATSWQGATRPLCPYPQMAKWDNSSTFPQSDHQSWHCA